MCYLRLPAQVCLVAVSVLQRLNVGLHCALVVLKKISLEEWNVIQYLKFAIERENTIL